MRSLSALQQLFDRALGIRPSLCEALFGKAALLIIEKDYEKAERFLKQCQQDETNSAKFQYFFQLFTAFRERRRRPLPVSNTTISSTAWDWIAVKGKGNDAERPEWAVSLGE